MTSISHQIPSETPFFKGFPFLLTYFTGCLYHVILLPKASGQEDYKQIDLARHQAQANRLPTWLIRSEKEALFFDAVIDLPAIVPVPRPRSILFGKLVPRDVIQGTEEIVIRYLNLSLHADYLHGDGPALYVGDLSKGGRPASDAEIDQFSGCQPNSAPNGLRQCNICQGWYGICLDTTMPHLLVSVHCRCQNDNRCARCSQLLYGFKLNSNYFSESDWSIWHVPGFCATKHQCPQAVESWATQRFISLKIARCDQ